MILYKKDVIDKLSEKTGLYKKDIKAMLVALNELVYEEMDNDNAILLNNLLKIEPVTIPPRNRYDIVRDKVYQHEAWGSLKYGCPYIEKRLIIWLMYLQMEAIM